MLSKDQCLVSDKDGPTWICSSISADERTPRGVFSDCAAITWHKITMTTNQIAHTRFVIAILCAFIRQTSSKCRMSSCHLYSTCTRTGRREVER